MKTENEIFFSSPVSSLSNKELEEFTEILQEIEKHLLESKGTKVFCAAIDVKKKKGFDSPADSVNTDLDKISRCAAFVMFYPKKVASSALIELGYAVAFEKPILIVAKNAEDLPYMAKGMPSALGNFKIHCYKTIDTNTLLRIEEVIDVYLREH